MDELVVADVDADVGEGALHGVEEHQVARLQLAAADLQQAGGVGLLVRPARQHHADTQLEDVPGEAAAIEAALGTGATTAVGHAEEVHRRHHQFGGGGADRLAHRLHRLRQVGGVDVRQQAALFEQPYHRVWLGLTLVRRGLGAQREDQRQANQTSGGTAGNRGQRKRAKFQHGREVTSSVSAISYVISTSAPCFGAKLAVQAQRFRPTVPRQCPVSARVCNAIRS